MKGANVAEANQSQDYSMRDNLKKIIGIILLLIFVFAAVLAFFQRNRAANIQQAVVETRRTLREQGFKTDLADFNLTTDAATRSREAALTFFSGYVQPMSAVDTIDLLPATGDGSVVVIWKQNWLKGEDGNVTWSDLRDTLEENRPELDAACDAALSGPIQFDLDASHGNAMLLRHLAPLRRLAQTLESRTVAELHDGHPDAAWTNLLALTRLATAWNVEPAEVSQLVRFGLVNFGFNAAWQALQNDRWPDEKLAALQREWESADFFANLPDTVAFKRASDVALCQHERQQPLADGMTMSEIVKQSVHAPGMAISFVKESWSAARYRSYGTFDDEKNMLLFYQVREREMRHAVASPAWIQMRALPGVTNVPIFTSPYHSRVIAMMSLRASAMRRLNENSSLLARAATAEARRRISVTAIALERFRLHHGAYPQTLAELAPEFLKTIPLDFMDGQPLRYQLAADGNFVLYSVGLDCIDNGGKLPAPGSSPMRRAGFGLAGPEPDADIVWPRPAGTVAMAAQQEQEMDAARTKADEDKDREAAYLWVHTDKRQAQVGKLLDAPEVTNVPEVTIQGHPLSETLSNPSPAGTNKLSLAKIFTFKQIITGDEPETVTFELPIACDVATNLGELVLMIDPNYETDDEEGSGAQQVEYNRAANGDVLLVWHTIYESPGQHVLQAAFFENGGDPDKPVCGPFLPFIITNLCQFTLGSATYDVELGARFHARLPEKNGNYSIECVTTNGAHLATLTGTTTNGEFNIIWNLTDDHGQRLTGETFNSIVHITLPDSGRRQTLRGP